MAKLKEELWKTLQQLTNDEFKLFKWFLKEDDVLEGFGGIAAAKLEGAERQDTVDLMVQKYHDSGILQVTLEIFKKISRNDLHCLLEKNLQLKGKSRKDLKTHHCIIPKSDCDQKKAELRDKIKLMIQERQMKIDEIKHSAELSSKSADRHITESEQAFTIILQFVSRSLAKLIETINEKRKSTQKQADKFIEELEQDITELTNRNKKMEQLSCTEHHSEFLQKISSLSSLPITTNFKEFTIPPPSYGRNIASSVNELERKFSNEKDKLIAKAKLNRAQEFAKDVTLDPDTANPYLILSDDGKQIYCSNVRQNRPDNPKSFNTACNVLAKQSFSSGRFYYEVQVEGMAAWDLGVVKESIDRKGSITASPENGFWTICLRKGLKYRASSVHLSLKHQPKKVGVFVDYANGSVSFYDVDSADLIHHFTACSFTEKLYPFFSPGCLNGGNNTPLIISDVNYTD